MKLMELSMIYDPLLVQGWPRISVSFIVLNNEKSRIKLSSMFSSSENTLHPVKRSFKISADSGGGDHSHVFTHLTLSLAPHRSHIAYQKYPRAAYLHSLIVSYRCWNCLKISYQSWKYSSELFYRSLISCWWN